MVVEGGVEVEAYISQSGGGGSGVRRGNEQVGGGPGGGRGLNNPGEMWQWRSGKWVAM